MEKSAPEVMFKTCDAAVSREGTMYINANGGNKAYSYNIECDSWSCLPDCPNTNCSFAVVDNKLTAIGGLIGGQCSKKVFSLNHQRIQRLQWVEELPPMPTKRHSTTSICTQTSLIVAGGYSGWSDLTCVEVFNIETRQWSTAADMPGPTYHASGVICGDRLYVGGGDSDSVYYCLTSDLLQSCQSVSATVQQRSSNTTSIWNKLTNLPEAIAFGSTLLSLCDHMLAIGGSAVRFSDNPSKSVYIYNLATDSWRVISQMLVAKRDCFAATQSLPTNKVIVVGGYSNSGWTDAVELANVNIK